MGDEGSAKMALEARTGLLNDAFMPPQPHRSGRRRRSFFRQNPRFIYIVFFMIVIALLVAGLMVLLTSPSFVKPR